MRLLPIFLGFLLLVGNGGTALAASQKATALRQANGLVAFTPTDKFLAGNFVADEMNPAVIFGTVKAFAASRKCPTTWLIEEGEKARLAAQGSPDQPVEYTLYLEEDCPDKVVYYVFIDQSRLTPQQWIDWRENSTRARQESSLPRPNPNWNRPARRVRGRGRTAFHPGERGPDDQITGRLPAQDLKFAPIYDLNQQKKISK